MYPFAAAEALCIMPINGNAACSARAEIDLTIAPAPRNTTNSRRFIVSSASRLGTKHGIDSIAPAEVAIQRTWKDAAVAQKWTIATVKF